MTITFNSGLKHGQKRSANLLNVVNASTTAGKKLYGSVAAIYAHTPMCTAVIWNFFFYSRLPITRTFKGNRKRVPVIGSSKKIAEIQVKNSCEN